MLRRFQILLCGTSICSLVLALPPIANASPGALRLDLHATPLPDFNRLSELENLIQIQTQDGPTKGETVDGPTEQPSEEPTEQPTDETTHEPTEEPTDYPSDPPTEEPTTEEPTTEQPTDGGTIDDGHTPPKAEYKRSDSQAAIPARAGLSDRQTKKIVLILNEGQSFCSALPWEYRPDCIRYFFWRAAKDLPQTGEYAPVRKALMKAVSDLERIRDANADPALPAQAFKRSGGSGAKTPRLKAVNKKARKKIARDVEKVIENTRLVLLRSTENSEKRTLHFTQVAKAVAGNKVLLRSA